MSYASRSDNRAARTIIEQLERGRLSTKKEAGLLRELEKSHTDDFATQLFLGDWYRERGDPKKADPFYRRALERSPSDEEAICGGALVALSLGRNRTAYRLLKPMIDGKIAPRERPLARLAIACHDDRDPERVMEAASIVLEHFPTYANNDYAFYHAVHESENKLYGTSSLLPFKGRRSRLPWDWLNNVIIAVVAIAVLFVGGIVALNLYMRTQTPVYFVNMFAKPAVVFKNGKQVGVVEGKSHAVLRLGEGTHTISVVMDGEKIEERHITVKKGILERFSYTNRIFAYNIGMGAVLLRYNTTYVPLNHQYATDDPEIDIFHHSFVDLGKVEFPFKDFPATIKTTDDKQSVRRRSLQVVERSPHEMVAFFHKHRIKRSHTLTYLEAHLRHGAFSTELLRDYVAEAIDAHKRQRAEAFMRTHGVKNGVVRVAWWRAYLRILSARGEAQRALREARALVKAHPRSAAARHLLELQDTKAPASQKPNTETPLPKTPVTPASSREAHSPGVHPQPHPGAQPHSR